MPVKRIDYITRAMVRANPDWLFIFGDNEQRQGFGGQAAAMRGEPNAVGVATKRTPGVGESAYWSDEDYNRVREIIIADFKPAFRHLLDGGVVVFPSAGIGTGLSELPKRAPRIMGLIEDTVGFLEKIGSLFNAVPKQPRSIKTPSDPIEKIGEKPH